MKRKKNTLLILFAVLACLTAGIVGYSFYGSYKMKQIPELTFEEALNYTTDANQNAVITVGIIKNGKSVYTVYGENGKVLPQQLHTYEIGSVTKTFTASLVAKAIEEGKLSLSDTIDQYLQLPQKDYYPTIERLLTHTSGYKAYYFESPMISNFFSRKNDFYRITKDMLLTKTADIELKDKDYPFHYSNFGYAVLGLVLEEIYQEDYTTLVNRYTQEDLALHNTRISDGNRDLANYWDWNEQDAYLPAGAIMSDVSDMLDYAKMQLEGAPSYFKKEHKALQVIDASTQVYIDMDIRMDEIGMSWIIDSKHNIIWHNGATGNYNSYLGFNTDTGTAVVILSNLPPNYRIPATVLGTKLLLSLQPSKE